MTKFIRRTKKYFSWKFVQKLSSYTVLNDNRRKAVKAPKKKKIANIPHSLTDREALI